MKSPIGEGIDKCDFDIFVIMEAIHFTREELAEYILDMATESVVNKIKNCI